MGKAMDVLAQQSRIVPTILFRIPGSVSSKGPMSEPSSFADTESEEPHWQYDNEDNHNEFL